MRRFFVVNLLLIAGLSAPTYAGEAKSVGLPDTSTSTESSFNPFTDLPITEHSIVVVVSGFSSAGASYYVAAPWYAAEAGAAGMASAVVVVSGMSGFAGFEFGVLLNKLDKKYNNEKLHLLLVDAFEKGAFIMKRSKHLTLEQELGPDFLRTAQMYFAP